MTSLTGATSVAFIGTAATFTVNSAGTAISTTVPAGATDGPVHVVTPGGTLSNKVTFRVFLTTPKSRSDQVSDWQPLAFRSSTV